MRALLRTLVVASCAAWLVLGCANGGDADDDIGDDPGSMDSGAPPEHDGAARNPPPPGGGDGATNPAKDAGSKGPGDSSPAADASKPSTDASKPSGDASDPSPDVSAPTPDVVVMPPPPDASSPAPDSGSGSDECDTSNPIYAIEAAAEIADGDEQLCVTGCSALQCCYELLCVAK